MALKRFVFASDVHGDLIDEDVNAALVNFIADFKPHHRVCGGDVFDLRAWRAGASDADKLEDTRADQDRGIRWLKKDFRPTHLLYGNHDRVRLARALKDRDGRVRNYAETILNEIEAVVGKLGCHTFPYHVRDGVCRIGHLKMAHGFYAGADATRKMANAYGSILFGHVHAIDCVSIPGCDRRVARACGAICRLFQDYNETHPNTLRHANGWAYGTIDEKTGDYQVFQAERVNGKFVVAGSLQVIAA